MTKSLFSNRPCERWCPKPDGCDRWLHFSRFRKRKRGRVGSPPVYVWEFDPICKACQQRLRNEKKNADRPREILDRRAAAWANQLGVAKEFLWVDMGWRTLVPLLRAMMTSEGLCPSCGHPFDHERDIQIEHHEPPRSDDDWARHSARNLGILCQCCNATKGDQPFADWLDDQEEARKSNGGSGTPQLRLDGQLMLFEQENENSH